MGTRDDEYDYLFKGKCSASSVFGDLLFASDKEVVQGRISEGPRLCSVVVAVLKIGFGRLIFLVLLPLSFVMRSF